jgi:hypothetical protein
MRHDTRPFRDTNFKFYSWQSTTQLRNILHNFNQDVHNYHLIHDNIKNNKFPHVKDFTVPTSGSQKSVRVCF